MNTDIKVEMTGLSLRTYRAIEDYLNSEQYGIDTQVGNGKRTTLQGQLNEGKYSLTINMQHVQEVESNNAARARFLTGLAKVLEKDAQSDKSP